MEINKKYGRLIPIKFAEKRKRNNYWLFKCDCGNEKIICANSVKKGRTKSCGCGMKLKGRKPRFFSHLLSNSRFYKLFLGIVGRTKNPKHTSFRYYGGKGILLCNRWNKFEKFRDDMYESYLEHSQKFGEKNTSIDRIDNKSGYSPQNCQWVTTFEQYHHKG